MHFYLHFWMNSSLLCNGWDVRRINIKVTYSRHLRWQNGWWWDLNWLGTHRFQHPCPECIWFVVSSRPYDLDVTTETSGHSSTCVNQQSKCGNHYGAPKIPIQVKLKPWLVLYNKTFKLKKYTICTSLNPQPLPPWLYDCLIECKKMHKFLQRIGEYRDHIKI